MQPTALCAAFAPQPSSPLLSNSENDGYFPVTIEALPEGTVAHTHVPVYQIFAEGEYARLVTFLETILTQMWYPSNIATLSRRCKQHIGDAFEKSVDKENFWLLNSRLHDFGFRGSSCVEASIIGTTIFSVIFTTLYLHHDTV